MPGVENQRTVFEFLLDHFISQELFTPDEMVQATNWAPKSIKTYLSKQLKQFISKVEGTGKFRVSEGFRPYADWDAFRAQVVSQVRRASRDYKKTVYENLIVFEFFMPLTNEGPLRTSLDSLFYKDMLERRLRHLLGNAELSRLFPRRDEEGDPGYLNRLSEWAGNRFQGYSISHVNGRYRGHELATQVEAAKLLGRYLVDETTAIVRFIFPIADVAKEAALTRWLFHRLFVESVVEVVNGEDEIWMVESGMENRLHTWKVESKAESATSGKDGEEPEDET